MKKQNLEIIVPVCNEERNITLLYEKIKSLNLELNYNIIFIDDGSTDSTLEIIKKINHKDKRVRAISFSRNFGHQIALSAGIDYSDCDILIMMDGDFQHPPENIPIMIKKYEEGYDVVQLVKVDQGKRNFLQKISSYIFYLLFRRISGVKISNNVSDFRLISKKVILEIKKFNEKERFLRGIVQWVGFKYIELTYDVGKRNFGKSKYNFFQLIKLASFGVFGYSSFPLKLSLYIGFVISSLSFLYGLYAILKKFLYPDKLPIGYTDIIVMITFLGGIQLIFLGIIGLYLSKVFDQVKDRPIYIINEKI